MSIERTYLSTALQRSAMSWVSDSSNILEEMNLQHRLLSISDQGDAF